MAETKIEWAHYTFNAWEGCRKISPGCTNCYAAKRDQWLHKGKHWNPSGTPLRLFHKPKYWDHLDQWNAEAKAAGEMRRVFCGSLMDILEDLPQLEQPRADLCAQVRRTPWLIYLFLTKRPVNWDLFPTDWVGNWPYNAMLGVTGENQKHLNMRLEMIEKARSVYGSRMRNFLSLEPLLGEIRLTERHAAAFEWAIAGGESGSINEARPARREWFERIADDTERLGMAFLFKQWGNWKDGKYYDKKTDPGRILKGREYNGFPSWHSYRPE